MYRLRFACIIGLVICLYTQGYSQNVSKTYPSLLWEITGNGLQKPSYLFGTMHVSSKMVFHLPDSFYYAIKNVDAVALELNPDLWQGEMVRLDQLQLNYKNFIQASGNDYLNERSFQIENYEDELKTALNSEPTVVNSLLYRTYKSKEDFEEDTFLDLYIFQTGKKLGKRATGVEDYYETSKIILEAYSDMAKEKTKKIIDTDGESMSDIGQKMQDAYRKGDLDILDSLNRMMDKSEAFTNKFLYKRNEIQANSIDTIIKKSSLFVGVGAAHLAGNKGVIELLRKKGYILRPVLMADRDAVQKDEIDKLKVPVTFKTNTIEDGTYRVDMPGPLYKMADDNSGLYRRQYADMGNGTYYVVTRVKTNVAFTGNNQGKVLKKIDSLLYENIPGKIISKAIIQKNGYCGYDITNKTRRGDVQRYQIFATPFEVLIFKMSGKENYVQGEEANKFFSSIQIREPANGWINFEPKQGGFKINMPQQPHEFLNTSLSDGIERWEYEAVDKNTGDAFLVLKKSINNFRFIEEDTFDLGLMEESFKLSDFFNKETERQITSFKGYPALDVQLNTKDGGIVKGKFLIKGSQYYLLAATSANAKADLNKFFESFNFTPFKYEPGKPFVDTFLHYSVTTSVIPDLEENLRSLIEKIGADNSSSYGLSGLQGYWPKTKTEVFKSDSTGEEINISMQQYPKYYYVKDSMALWHDVIDDYLSKNDFILADKRSFKIGKDAMAYQLILKDTNSSRVIKRVSILKNNRMYRIISIGDTLSKESDFVKGFFSSFDPQAGSDIKQNIFKSKTDEFLNDFFSADSANHTNAQSAISNVYYTKHDIKKLKNAIGKLKYGDRDYFDSKTKFIAELGYIRDAEAANEIVQTLKNIYYKTADTGKFQNKVLQTLAKHRSRQAFGLLKELLLQDPPVFESEYDYTTFFSDIADSLLLAKQLFPEILQLASIDDYKSEVNELLVKLVDSNIITAKDYESYFPKIYFDAKIELKKQLGKDEKQMEEENSRQDNHKSFNKYSSEKDDVDNYAVLLMPFYDTKPAVQKFFYKLLNSKDPLVRLRIAVLMLRNKKAVTDSILHNFAVEDKYRSKLFEALEDVDMTDKFPVNYKNQSDMARSILLSDKVSDKIDSIVNIGKQSIVYRNKKGWVYFFKYRVKKDDEWKMGLSGLQPENLNEVSSDKTLMKMTDKRLKADAPVAEQFNQQLKKLLFSLHKSSKKFYESSRYNLFKKDYSD